MATNPDDLPYKAEYAKSGRASCKMCKTPIPQNSLRIAAMVQSHFHDGKMANWFHQGCFFKKQRPASEGDIANYENLRYEDQQKIKEQIAAVGAVVETSGKGKKRPKEESAAMKDYGIEYAKSGRAACRGCELKILKDEIRVKKVVFDTEVGMKYGGQPLWHHLECFAKLRNELGWFVSGDLLPGFKSLKKDDQKTVKTQLPAIKSEDIPSKKLKTEVKDEVDAAEDEKLDKKIAKQMKTLFKYRDAVQKNFEKSDIQKLLTENGQDPPHDSGKLLDLVADILTFGALKPCEKCGGQLEFSRSGYMCTGNISEWVKCDFFVKEPEREKCKVNSELKQKYKILQNYKGAVETRAVKYIAPSTKVLEAASGVKKEEELQGTSADVDGPKIKREKPPLYEMEFVIIGLRDTKDDIKARIIKMGGKVVTQITETVLAVISSEEEVKKKNSKMAEAQSLGIQVVTADFLDAAKEDPSGVAVYISTKSICDWGTNVFTRMVANETKKSQSSMSSKSIYTKSVPKSVKLKVKGGTAVDPDSGLEDVAHVYVKGDNKYTVVLGLTDIQKKKNSYYKLQLLERTGGNRYWLFRSWGRIGTTIGGTKCEQHHDLHSAMKEFKDLYLEKTGNHWEDRHQFEKVPGRMYPIDIDYGEDEKSLLASNDSGIKSKLPERVQEFIKLIFDVNLMKKVMLEFDLDMEKMPLGKLSQKQIQSAYKVLSEINELIQNGGSNTEFIECTNRFYTLIPHNFGIDNPPILNTTEQVKHHSDVLDNLIEIECAYSMLQGEQPKDDVNPIDQHYEQLKTDLTPLDKNSEEFKLLKQYVKNTHAETHRMYDLNIIDIFKVSRKGEARRYKPFKKLHNRKLLWHGSRLTNFAGILLHGLKIAPPEAPSTGYMFGKGIYFADMVSKSANYCCTTRENNTGLLLLSEVALGDMYECTAANYVTKLPSGKHSTKGVGRTQPNPKESHIREDGVEIPLGKPIQDNTMKSSLLYNEYIVYDIAQANIQYLFRVDFKYKY